MVTLEEFIKKKEEDFKERKHHNGGKIFSKFTDGKSALFFEREFYYNTWFMEASEQGQTDSWVNDNSYQFNITFITKENGEDAFLVCKLLNLSVHEKEAANCRDYFDFLKEVYASMNQNETLQKLRDLLTSKTVPIIDLVPRFIFSGASTIRFIPSLRVLSDYNSKEGDSVSYDDTSLKSTFVSEMNSLEKKINSLRRQRDSLRDNLELLPGNTGIITKIGEIEDEISIWNRKIDLFSVKYDSLKKRMEKGNDYPNEEEETCEGDRTYYEEHKKYWQCVQEVIGYVSSFFPTALKKLATKEVIFQASIYALYQRRKTNKNNENPKLEVEVFTKAELEEYKQKYGHKGYYDSFLPNGEMPFPEFNTFEDVLTKSTKRYIPEKAKAPFRKEVLSCWEKEGKSSEIEKIFLKYIPVNLYQEALEKFRANYFSWQKELEKWRFE